MTYQDEILSAFAGAYGRLCQLVAKALKQGHATTAVVEAAKGKGNTPAPVYNELRAQRKRMNAALQRAIDAHVGSTDIVETGFRINRAVAQEWMIELPAFSESK